MIQLSLEMPSQTHSEVCFTDLLGVSHLNNLSVKITHHNAFPLPSGGLPVVFHAFDPVQPSPISASHFIWHSTYMHADPALYFF
jgi:hypothetical protein